MQKIFIKYLNVFLFPKLEKNHSNTSSIKAKDLIKYEYLLEQYYVEK